MSLSLKTYYPENAIFPVASTVIWGARDAILIDAQFQASRAEEVVALIKGLGRNLTTIFISHHDPDYYFGLDTIHRAFPGARIVSTPQTAWLIASTRDDKLAVWKDQLGADAPKELILPEPVTGALELDEDSNIKSTILHVTH